ncbi:hypothetical protein A3709_19835 [Halioglobus sp. HI00S01]|uniref:hypothetical protein n=1 Tax=Halioglobus sp. HI00S01 TaxID=1822214 RepID=UPI0007C24C42|nr:hypothetical protein [Halioglobus sp. HI00S01]KZX57876.1 hypothetical protein A3709_19835 [Halioglobus sp. HI00S01]
MHQTSTERPEVSTDSAPRAITYVAQDVFDATPPDLREELNLAVREPGDLIDPSLPGVSITPAK